MTAGKPVLVECCVVLVPGHGCTYLFFWIVTSVDLNTVQVTNMAQLHSVLYLKTVASLMSIRFKMQIHVHGFSIDNCRVTHVKSILKLFTCCLWQELLRTTWTLYMCPVL